MKQYAAISVMAAVFLFSVPVQAETHSFAANCSFMRQGSDDLDSKCQVTHTYNAARQWIHTQIHWSDGVVTEIEIQTINRRPTDRVSSRFGLAAVDGESAEYSTFSDGGICFKIDRNQNHICYR